MTTELIHQIGRLGEELGCGGQAAVLALPDRRNQVYKRYNNDERPEDESLESVIEWRAQLSEPIRKYLDSRASWPVARVVDDRHQTLGVLLPRIPDDFYIQVSSLGRSLRKPGELQYLLYADQSRALGLDVPEVEGRLDLCREWLKIFSLFEHNNVVFGDISMRNLLWRSATNTHSVYLIDCDTAQAGGPFRPSPFTQDWDDPQLPAGAPADQASDRYKLALVVYRALWLTKKRPTTAEALRATAPRGVPPNLIELIIAGVDSARTRRPPLSQWLDALGGHGPIDSRLPPPPTNPQGGPTGTRERSTHILPDAPAKVRATRVESRPASGRAAPPVTDAKPTAQRERMFHRLDEVSSTAPPPARSGRAAEKPSVAPGTPQPPARSTNSYLVGAALVVAVVVIMLIYAWAGGGR